MLLKLARRIGDFVFHSRSPAFCWDLRVPARRCGWHALEVHPPIDDFVNSTANEDPVIRHDYLAHLEFYRRPQTLVRIPGARVRDWIGLVQLPDGSICFEGNWWEPYVRTNPAYRDRFRRVRKVPGDVFSLLGMWSNEYYHWTHDILPKLWNCLTHLPTGCRFLLNSRPKEFQIQSLAALGIGEERLLYQEMRIETVVENLWFSTPHGWSTFSGPEAIFAVAEKILRHLGISRASGTDRIYISRAKAPCRRIRNEAEMVPVLKKHGFRIEVLENHRFGKQLEKLARSGILMGPHGAGLVNMIYSPSDSHVIEIAGADYMHCYEVLAKSGGRRFTRFEAAQEGRDGDYEVDLDKLDRFLAEIG